VKTTPLNDWLEKLGSKNPTPGGGAVAAINGAIAAAQLKMVCEYTKDNEVNNSAEIFNQKIETFFDLAEADSIAFKRVAESYKTKNPKDIDDSLLAAIQVSVDVAANCEAIIIFIEKNHQKFNTNLKADLVVVIANLKASIEGSAAMEKTNLYAIKGSKPEGALDHINFCEELIGQLNDLKAKIEELE
jgi:formiminotetrahydrofolate cyclodeaminase